MNDTFDCADSSPRLKAGASSADMVSIMFKKILALAVFSFLAILFPTMTYAANKSDAPVLGVSREQWRRI